MARRIMVDLEKCMGCRTCEVQCALIRSTPGLNVYEAARPGEICQARVSVQGGEEISFPVRCQQCEDAPCLAACPSGALARDEAGVVIVNEQRCIGCWMCVMTCPFGAIAPAPGGKAAVKCDTCRHMEVPACVEACPMRALSIDERGDLALLGAARRRRTAAKAEANKKEVPA